MEERVIQLLKQANRLNNELTAVLIQLHQYIPKEAEWTDGEKAVFYFTKNFTGYEPSIEEIREAINQERR